MLSIGNKKYRNLQEQVAYNTECIQELAEIVDGITLEDKLVIIANDSGTFSEKEMTVLNGPLAFISDGSKVWLKQSETASEFIFKAIDIVATEVGGTYYNVGGSKIVVTRTTRAYATSDDVIITTYNKAQMDALLNAKADLSGADFTGAVTAQTLEQSQANWSANLTTFPNLTGGTPTLIYGRAQQINKELHIVLIGKIENNSGATISAYGTTTIDIVFPEEIAEKIYDYAGKTAKASDGDNTIISMNFASALRSNFVDMSTFQNNMLLAVVNRSSANTVALSFRRNSAITIEDGQTMYFEGRVALDLL